MGRKKSATECPDSADFSGHGEEADDPTDGLTTRQAKALSALLQEPTLARAAAVAGVGERSLRRWLTEPAFRDAVFRARRETFGQAIWLTQRYAAVAVATLVKVMQDEHAPPSSKVAAAGMLLKFGREGIELDDLAERVEQLERAGTGEGPRRDRPHHNGSHDDEEDDEP